MLVLFLLQQPCSLLQSYIKEIYMQSWDSALPFHSAKESQYSKFPKTRFIVYVIWCNPILRSEDMEMRRGREWCHAALKTRFWWALIDCEGWLALNLMSNIWITGSAEPEVIYKPSGDHVWLIKADWDMLLSCFQPNSCISVFFNLMSNNLSCFCGVLQVYKILAQNKN